MDFDEIAPLKVALNIDACEYKDFTLEYLESRKRGLEDELSEIKEKLYACVLMDPRILTKDMESPLEELREKFNDMFWNLVRTANEIHELGLAIDDAAYSSGSSDVLRFMKEWSEARKERSDRDEARVDAFRILGLDACSFDDHAIFDYLYDRPDLMERYMSAGVVLSKSARERLLEQIKAEGDEAIRAALRGSGNPTAAS